MGVDPDGQFALPAIMFGIKAASTIWSSYNAYKAFEQGGGKGGAIAIASMAIGAATAGLGSSITEAALTQVNGALAGAAIGAGIQGTISGSVSAALGGDFGRGFLGGAVSGSLQGGLQGYANAVSDGRSGILGIRTQGSVRNYINKNSLSLRLLNGGQLHGNNLHRSPLPNTNITVGSIFGQTVLDDNGLTAYQSPGYLNRAFRTRTIRGRIYSYQSQFINNSIDIGIGALDNAATLTTAMSLMIGPYAPPVGGILLSAETVMSNAANVSKIGISLIRQDYTSAVYSIGLLGFGQLGNQISRIPYTSFGQRKILESIYSNWINFGNFMITNE